MEIDDLVNTIEDLNEELAVEIVGRAEVLAEEQADEMPRRKGARPQQPATPAVAEAPPAAEDAEPKGDRAGQTTLDDLFSDEARDPIEGRPDEEAVGGDDVEVDRSEAQEQEVEVEVEEFRDLALAAEPLVLDPEVTSPPSDEDQSETEKIVTEAVEAGASRAEVEANPAGEGPNVPPLPPTEPFSVDEAEDRETDMRQP